MSFSHSNSRLESFSDAVFAFAATLIVVSFEVPNNFERLQELLWGFFGFGISFLVLALLWYVHYLFFRRIEKIDGLIIFLNMSLLFVILFYVYPMKFLVNLSTGVVDGINADQFSLLFQLYGIGFILIFMLIFFMHKRASKIHQGSAKNELKYWSEHFLMYAIVGAISVVLAWIQVGLRIGLPGFVYGLIGLFAFIHSKKRNHLISKD